MIKILDYGFGNIASVFNAFLKVQENVEVINDITKAACDDVVVLPGVGSFDNAVERLTELGAWSVLKDRVKSGNPTIGICLGAQLLCKTSEEGNLGGLSAFDVEVVKFGDDSQCPNMGWRTVISGRLEDLGMFYFTHSFHFHANVHEEFVFATSKNDEIFPAVLRKKNIWAIQFHPEKSQNNGINFLKHVLSEIT